MVQFHFRTDSMGNYSLMHLLRWVGKYWFQLAICGFLVHMHFSRNVQFFVTPEKATHVNQQFSVVPTASSAETKAIAEPVANPKFNEDQPYGINPKWKPSDFRNLSFILNPTFAQRKGVSPEIVEEKLMNCKNYVDRFSSTAIIEMEKYGIPASITLAQGLLETDAGGSRLATESNNHFGIKCRSKCRGCTCRNYSDDDVYDMFRVFNSVWESYREHSKLLQISRYAHLKSHGTKDYQSWAVGLKKAGYATDKNYHKKLIRIIETLNLHRFDK